jgi:subtilase family serine protease
VPDTKLDNFEIDFQSAPAHNRRAFCYFSSAIISDPSGKTFVESKSIGRLLPPAMTVNQVNGVPINQPINQGESMKQRLSMFLIAIVAMALATSIFSQAQPQQLLTRHVVDATHKGEAPFVGKLPATQSLRFDIVLPVRDEAALDTFLQNVYNPSSPNYRQFLTVDQFTQMFGPSQEHWDALVRFAKASGFTVTGGSRDAMDIRLTGSVANVETAFHVTLGVYHDPVNKRDFYAPDREPTVDLPFQLKHVSGLDNYWVPRNALARRNPGVKRPATTGSCPDASFCGSDMRAAYYEGTSLTGKGQIIGLLEFAGYDIADLNTYYKNANQKRTAAIKGISTDGTPLKCLFSQGCDDTEQTIDMTQALGMAPGIGTLYMYVGSTGTALLSAMSSDKPLPLNLSSSWYRWGTNFTSDDMYFKKMASQGQSFFEAAGDGGNWGDNTDTYWPMESPYVICVGGTDLVTKGAGKAWASETVWVDGGGGISPDHLPIASWQKLKGVITKANEGSTKYRNGPDVSANSNFSFYVCADQTTCTANLYGGTSFAAPMFAGYLALANQQAAAHGDKPPGFINPTIYPLGLGSGYHTDFHDITVGSDGLPATKGYDLASGWGSPNTDGLINALAK